jgi:L-aminopeptidase/D-esterase-like protein
MECLSFRQGQGQSKTQIENQANAPSVILPVGNVDQKKTMKVAHAHMYSWGDPSSSTASLQKKYRQRNFPNKSSFGN